MKQTPYLVVTNPHHNKLSFHILDVTGEDKELLGIVVPKQVNKMRCVYKFYPLGKRMSKRDRNQVLNRLTKVLTAPTKKQEIDDHADEMERDDYVKADPHLRGIFILYDEQFASGWISPNVNELTRRIKRWIDEGKPEDEQEQLLFEFFQIPPTEPCGPDVTETTVDFGYEFGPRIKQKRGQKT